MNKLIPRKYSQKMHTLELMVGVAISALPSLTSGMTVQQAGWVMLIATMIRAYLVSVKQDKE